MIFAYQNLISNWLTYAKSTGELIILGLSDRSVRSLDSAERWAKNWSKKIVNHSAVTTPCLQGQAAWPYSETDGPPWTAVPLRWTHWHHNCRRLYFENRIVDNRTNRRILLLDLSVAATAPDKMKMPGGRYAGRSGRRSGAGRCIQPLGRIGIYRPDFWRNILVTFEDGGL